MYELSNFNNAKNVILPLQNTGHHAQDVNIQHQGSSGHERKLPF